MAAGRDRELVEYLVHDVALHAPPLRQRLGEALAGGRLKSADDLARMAPVSLEEVTDPASLVLRPRLPRRSKGAAEMERAYKPVHWLVQEGVPIGSSASDVERLGGLGARWLTAAGVRGDDVVVGFLPAGPHLPYWQLVLGAMRLGVSAVFVPPVPSVGDVARLRPSVLVGRPYDLVRLLEDRSTTGAAAGWRSRVRLLIAAGEPLDDALRARLAGLLVASDAAVVSAWAPPGVRALWWECPGATALHTWPEAEVVQIADPLSGAPAPPGAGGEVVWTALGWHGTVLVRLRTGVFARLVPGPCPSCGARGPLLEVDSATPSFLRVLDDHAGVAGWQAELRTAADGEELFVFMSLAPGAPLPALLAELDGELFATQYVVLDAAGLDARMAAHGDRKVVDLRA
ncbi:MAG TPA: AMP-binding protein [Acidimicrobiales bacterium]|nr:AMP-binding protein [Acidimicrobiales bacterium]